VVIYISGWDLKDQFSFVNNGGFIAFSNKLPEVCGAQCLRLKINLVRGYEY